MTLGSPAHVQPGCFLHLRGTRASKPGLRASCDWPGSNILSVSARIWDTMGSQRAFVAEVLSVSLCYRWGDVFRESLCIPEIWKQQFILLSASLLLISDDIGYLGLALRNILEFSKQHHFLRPPYWDFQALCFRRGQAQSRNQWCSLQTYREGGCGLASLKPKLECSKVGKNIS